MTYHKMLIISIAMQLRQLVTLLMNGKLYRAVKILLSGMTPSIITVSLGWSHNVAYIQLSCKWSTPTLFTIDY